MNSTDSLTIATSMVPLSRVMKYHSSGAAGAPPTINFAAPQFDPPPAPPLQQAFTGSVSPPSGRGSTTHHPSALDMHLAHRHEVGETAPVYAPVVSEVTPNQRPSSVTSTPLNLPSIVASPLKLPQSGGNQSSMMQSAAASCSNNNVRTSADGSFDGDRALAPCLLGLSTPSVEHGQLLDNASPSVEQSHVSEQLPHPAHARSASSSSSVLPPHSEFAIVDSKKAVVLFVSASDRNCLLATRFFCTRITHFLAWGGDCARMFTLGRDDDSLHWFGETPKDRWREALTGLAASVTEYLGMQHVLGLAATPTAIILGDFAQEAALFAAEKDMMAAWELLPGVRTTQQNISFRYIRFSEKWISELADLAGAVNVVRRSYVEVNLSIETLRSTLSSSGVVCAMVVGYLVQVLPIICHVHRNEPRTGSSKGTMQSLPPLFFTRHGQSKYNIEDRLGGDPELTPAGVDDARAIGMFFEQEVRRNPYLFGGMTERWVEEEGFEVWCSQLQRTKSTAQPTANTLTKGVVRMWSSLNEIHAGVCEDMTNEEVMGTFPSLHQFRKLNKVAFRYPSGESYLDLMIRLKPVLLSLDTSKKCVVVVAHQAVLRTLLSYFGGRPVEEAVTSECPHRTVWCCSFDKAGCARLATISLPEADRVENWQGI